MRKLLTLIAFIPIIVSAQYMSTVDSLLRQLQYSKDDTTKVDLYRQLLDCSLAEEDRAKYVDGMMALCNKLNYHRGIAQAYVYKAWVYVGNSKTAKAMECYRSAEVIFKDIGDRVGLGRTLGNIGYLYFYNEKYGRAIETLLQSRAKLRQANDSVGLSYTLYWMGNAYSMQQDFTNALKYYLEAEMICEKSKNKKGLALICLQTAMVYSQQKKYNETTSYANAALSAAKETEDSVVIASAKKLLKETLK